MCVNDTQVIDVEVMEEISVIPVDYTLPRNLTESSHPVLHVSKCNAKPVCVYQLPYGEELAFPHLFQRVNMVFLIPAHTSLTLACTLGITSITNLDIGAKILGTCFMQQLRMI